MRLIDFIFYIIGRFNLLNREQYSELYNEIDHDLKITQTEEGKPGFKGSWKTKIAQYDKSPYRRLLNALLAIPVVKWIQDWMLSKPEEEEDEDDETALPNPLQQIRRK